MSTSTAASAVCDAAKREALRRELLKRIVQNEAQRRDQRKAAAQ